MSTNISIQDKSSKTKKKRQEVKIYDISKIKKNVSKANKEYFVEAVNFW